MALIHERTFRVRQYECDAYGHVNHANYLRYMQETAFDASAAASYDLARYREIQRAWLVRETDITYLQPLVYNDQVTVKTWVLNFRRVRSRRAYDLHHADSIEIVARSPKTKGNNLVRFLQCWLIFRFIPEPDGRFRAPTFFFSGEERPLIYTCRSPQNSLSQMTT